MVYLPCQSGKTTRKGKFMVNLLLNKQIYGRQLVAQVPPNVLPKPVKPPAPVSNSAGVVTSAKKKKLKLPPKPQPPKVVDKRVWRQNAFDGKPQYKVWVRITDRRTGFGFGKTAEEAESNAFKKALASSK